MAAYVIFRAFFGYLFLVLIVRVVGRRPGKQLTPFEFVLVFYLGGLTLTGMVGQEASLSNAVTQILTIGLTHATLAWLRFRFDGVARLLDGIPLTLLASKQWHAETMKHMAIQDDDVMDMARNQGLKNLDEVESATLESFGEITILPVEKEEE